MYRLQSREIEQSDGYRSRDRGYFSADSTLQSTQAEMGRPLSVSRTADSRQDRRRTVNGARAQHERRGTGGTSSPKPRLMGRRLTDMLCPRRQYFFKLARLISSPSAIEKSSLNQQKLDTSVETSLIRRSFSRQGSFRMTKSLLAFSL